MRSLKIRLTVLYIRNYRAPRETLAQSDPREMRDLRDPRDRTDPLAQMEMMAPRDIWDHLVPPDPPEMAPRAHSFTEAGTTLTTFRRSRK